MEGRGQTKEMSEKGEKTGDGGERIICFGDRIRKGERIRVGIKPEINTV